jgi:hypothetical protein
VVLRQGSSLRRQRAGHRRCGRDPPLWLSDVSPGSVHDLTAARRLVLPTLHTAVRDGLRVLADVGYLGATDTLLPIRKHPDLPQDLDPDNQTYNTLLCCIRTKGERAIAELKQRWRALQHATLSPNRMGAIARPPWSSTTPGDHER